MAAAVTQDWLSSRKLVPSWALSGVFHVVFLCLMFWILPYTDRGPVGFQDEPSQEIGIFIKNADDPFEPSATAAPDSDAQSHNPQSLSLRDPEGPRKVVPEDIPISVPLPQREESAAIGPGAAVPGTGVPDSKEFIKPDRAGQSRPAVSGGPPGASFMGTKDKGTRVVFVIDSSSSMLENQAMQQAKAALVSSLSTLEPTQLFQIVFYNETTQMLMLKSATKDKLYYATEANKAGAYRFIRLIDPSLSTSHALALQQALQLKSDMIFLLTDSGEPKLTARQLDDIQKFNKGRTRIHTIEFGIGPELNNKDGSNFLVSLAKQNHGTYRYVDVLAENLKKRERD